MKVITEAVLRRELGASKSKTYCIPEGKIVSPAAREYLSQLKIKIVDASEHETFSEEEAMPVAEVCVPETKEKLTPKFTDYETGAFYMEKPEHMTQLHDNVLIPKNHPRIVFRGKLDSLQADVVLIQAILHEKPGNQFLIEDLEDILKTLREVMRADVLEDSCHVEAIIGLDHAQLREHSHYPMKYYSIKQMVLPEMSLGTAYAMLNKLRCAIRETEIAAINAFPSGSPHTRDDIIEAFNRLSSAVHIIMCKYLAGAYQKEGSR